jgi:AraC family transcriptional regulator
MTKGGYGGRLGQPVGIATPPTIDLQVFHKTRLLVTRLSWDLRDNGYNAWTAREDAYLVCLVLKNVPTHPYWVDGRPVPTPLFKSGQFTLLNLNLEHACHLVDPVDCVAFYVSRAALDAIASEHNARRIGSLHLPPAHPIDDEVVRGLGISLLPALRQPQQANPLFLDSVALAFLAHMAGTYGEMSVTPEPRRGGLAKWQERRAKEALNAHIDGNISLERLASTVGLSRSHFARAFKKSTGMPPHRWLLARRVERAEELLLNSKLPIDEIAVRCGFADQSHFTRVFSSLRGIPPGEWRRRRQA